MAAAEGGKQSHPPSQASSTRPSSQRWELGEQRRGLLLAWAGLILLYLLLAAGVTAIGPADGWGLWRSVLPIGADGTLLTEGFSPSRLLPAPGLLSKIVALLGLLVMTVVPGLPLGMSFPSERPLTGVWLALRAAFLSLVGFIVNLSLLKGLALAGLGIHPTPLALLILGVGEGVLGLWLLRARWPELEIELEVPAPPRLLWAGLVLLTGVSLTIHHLPFIWRDLSAYWYHPDAFVQAAWDDAPGLEARGISLQRGEGWQNISAEHALFRKERVTEPQLLEIKALTATIVTLQYLWMGPVGSALLLDCEDVTARGEVAKAPEEVEGEGPTLRYLDQGLALVRLSVTVREARSCRLVPEGLATPALSAGGTEAGSTKGEVQAGILLDMSDWPAGGMVEAAGSQAWILTHYYQILNVAENILWGRELFATRWVTLNQPPVWSYVYASVMTFVGPGLWALNFFFIALVMALIVLAGAVARLEHEPDGLADVLCFVPLLLVGVMHARIIIESGSTNFPDNLYPVGVMAGIYALWQSQARGFAGAALTTCLIRYPGSAFLVLTPGAFALFNRARRRVAVQAAMWCGALLGVLALSFGLGGLLTGQLSDWFGILYFETLPEHFHDQYGLSELLPRPLEFYRLLLQYSGFTPLLTLVGLGLSRGRLPRQLLLSTLAYTGLLCFIDHFPSHYFVTPMYLLGAAFSSTLLGLQGWKRWGLLSLGLLGLVIGLQAPTG